MDSLILAPSKSITAVIGLTEESTTCHIARCMTCQAKTVRLERKNNHGYFKATWKTYYFFLRAAWVPFYSKMDLPWRIA